MIFKGFRFAWVLTVFSIILVNDSLAMGIQVEPIVQNSEVRGDKEKYPTVSDTVKDTLSIVDVKNNAVTVHKSELLARGVNTFSSENAVEISSISRPIFREHEDMNRPVQSAFDEQRRFQANSVQEIEKGGYFDELFSYKDFLDEVQTGLGEGVYRKLVWTYYDLKDLDDRIYASMAGYDLSAGNFLGKLQQFIGVDEQVNAMIVFGSSMGAMDRSIGIGENQNPNKISGSKVVLDISQRNFFRKDEVDTGRFQLVLKHLTIRNVIYSLLILMGIGMVWRIFRFFVKQDLS